MRIPFPDLLASKKGRLTAFFLLYVTEGIPLGFTATAIATQMRRQGLGPVAIGAFVGSLYLPWSFKWIAGPFVDTQDVAIDALAVNVLPEDERGLANGFMFAGASIGQAIGGSGVLFLSAVLPFSTAGVPKFLRFTSHFLHDAVRFS